MRAVLTSLLAIFSSTALRADFSYQDSTRVTAGALYNSLHPAAKGASDAIISTRMIKGNRMAEVTKERTTVIDLDKETITRIDLVKKTYSVSTFEQMKEALRSPDATFKISSKVTGQTKTIGVLTAKETVLTMTIDTAGQDPGESGAMIVTLDAWMAVVPGYEEVRAFTRKLGEKMGYAFGSGISQLALGRAEALQGLAEAVKDLGRVEGAPVQRTMKIVAGSDTAAPDAAVPPAFPPDPHQNPASAAANAALGRLGIGHKKSADQPTPSASGSVVETLTELTNFSSAPINASRFEVPMDFKQVTAELPQRINP
jgi:hypothetical protein